MSSPPPPAPTQHGTTPPAPTSNQNFVTRDEIQHVITGTMDLSQKYADLTGQISLLRSQIDALQGSVDALDDEVAKMQEQQIPHG